MEARRGRRPGGAGRQGGRVPTDQADGRVLGIDPGTAVTGWGVVERRGAGFAHLAHGTVVTRAGAPLAAKLVAIHAALADLWGAWAPAVLAIERTFVGRNVQSAFRLGEVRGVAMVVAAAAGAAVVEYTPAEVKLAVTGSGRAEKPQVQRMVARELGLAAPPAADAADALAVAICHLQSARMRLALAAVSGGRGVVPARLAGGRAAAPGAAR